MDVKGVSTTISNGVYHLTDRRVGMKFASIVKSMGDGLFVTPHSSSERYAANDNTVTPLKTTTIGTESIGTAA